MIRKYSTSVCESSDDDDTRTVLNRAMRMSYNETLSDNLNSHTINKKTDTKYKSNSHSVQQTIQAAVSSTSVEDQKVSGVEADQRNKNNMTGLPNANPKDILEEITIWPALETLETTLDKSGGSKSGDREETLDKLEKCFHDSPREFVETLTTIMEESFVAADESNGLLDLWRRVHAAEMLEDVSAPSMTVSRSNDYSADSLLRDLADRDSSNDSTQYASIPKQNTAKNEEMLKGPVKFVLHPETPESNSERLCRAVSPEVKSAGKKIYTKTPGLMANLGTARNCRSPCASISSLNNLGSSPRRFDGTFIKTPKIVICLASPRTPQSHCGGLRTPRKSCTDDDYLTAESSDEETEETEESGVTFEEPVASSTKRIDSSRADFYHSEYRETSEKVSEYDIVAGTNRKLSSHSKRLEDRWIRNLEEKHRKCFEMVERILEKRNRESPNCEFRESRSEFYEILRACSEYFSYGMKHTKNCCENCSPRNEKRFVTSVAVNLKKEKRLLSPRSSCQRARKSPRRSLSKNNVNFKLPGGGRPTPRTPKFFKRRSLKGVQSPIVDASSIKPVSQLRCIYSPSLRAAGVREVHTKPKIRKLGRSRAVSSQVLSSFNVEQHKRKFKHVVSPIAQYIKSSDKIEK